MFSLGRLALVAVFRRGTKKYPLLREARKRTSRAERVRYEERVPSMALQLWSLENSGAVEIHFVAFAGCEVIAPNRKLLFEGLGFAAVEFFYATAGGLEAHFHQTFGGDAVLREEGSGIFLHHKCFLSVVVELNGGACFGVPRVKRWMREVFSRHRFTLSGHGKRREARYGLALQELLAVLHVDLSGYGLLYTTTAEVEDGSFGIFSSG